MPLVSRVACVSSVRADFKIKKIVLYAFIYLPTVLCLTCVDMSIYVIYISLVVMFAIHMIGIWVDGIFGMYLTKAFKIANIIETLISTSENLLQQKVMHTIVGDLGTRL